MEKKKERKRIWVVKAAVVLLVVLALCTAAARTVWNMLLPRVETTTVYGGVLQDQAQLEGTVRYGGQQTVRADGDWEITEILVEEGQTVEEGTPLLRVDTTGWSFPSGSWSSSGRPLVTRGTGPGPPGAGLRRSTRNGSFWGIRSGRCGRSIRRTGC